LIENAALLIAAAIVSLAGVSIDAPPFTPIVPQPDYVVTMTEKSRDREDANRTVTHHGHLTRIDQSQGAFHITDYYSASGGRITVSGQSSINLERRTDSGLGVNGESRNTGERQTHLGESCTVWDVWRTRQSMYGSNVSHLSCITDDGITLWEKTLHGNDVLSSIEASHIERRPVSPEEVRIPRELLTLDWWDAPLPSFDGPSTPDHEMVMELSHAPADGTISIRTMRRLGPWQFTDETAGSRRRILITHDSRRMQLQYSSDQSGVPRYLTIRRPGAVSDSSTHRLVSETTDLSRSETILGETCRWFDMMPGWRDADRSACLTGDGIALKEVVSGRGMDTQTWIAVHLSRRPIRLDEIKPPPELLDPQTWGFE
jgi:hypothetical protein